jgi:hypothetical protein
LEGAREMKGFLKYFAKETGKEINIIFNVFFYSMFGGAGAMIGAFVLFTIIAKMAGAIE